MKRNRYSFGIMLTRLVLLAALLLAPVVSVPPASVRAGESGPTNPGAPAGIFLPLVQRPYTPPEPSAQEKIYAKYDAGEIDYETYLLYRAYALYGDLKLPAELRGRIAEDTTLFFEIEEPQLPLSAATLEKLHPYLVRPDHPDSAVNGVLPVPQGLALEQNAPVQDELPANYACSDSDGDGVHWATLDSTTLPLRVHRICNDSPDFDRTYVLAGMLKVLDDLEALWGPMTAHMGTAPLADKGGAALGGDERIDVYIIARAHTFQRDEPVSFKGSAAAFVRATPAKTPERPKAAGIMVLDQDDVIADDPVGLKSTIAHEFFHLLQYAHNADIMYNYFGEAYWFNDASAEWAAWHFVPAARRDIHSERFPGFQDDDLPLNTHGKNGSTAQLHNYDAYIWPFFMEQQAGAESIAAAWDGIATANTFSEADSVLNKQVGFYSDFHLFALRNLVDRENFDGAIPNPYQVFDPTFLSGVWPQVKEEIELFVNEAPHPVTVDLPHLTADYYHYTWDVNGGIQQIEISFEGVSPRGYLDVDALVRVPGAGWDVRSWRDANKIKLCLDQEQVNELYISLSNTDYANETPITGQMTIFPRREGCTCENLQTALSKVDYFTGPVHFDFATSISQGDEALTIEQLGDMTARLNVHNEEGTVFADLAPNGTSSIDWVYTVDGELVSDQHVSGPVVPDTGQYFYSRVMVAFEFDTCQYNLYAQANSPDEDGDAIETGSFKTEWLRIDPETLLITGGGSYPLYSPEYIEKNGPEPFFNAEKYELTDWSGEGFHKANVTFSFTPVFK